MHNQQEQSRILVITSVEAELEAVRRGIGADSTVFDLHVGGVGSTAAGIQTARLLAASNAASYSLVISTGIGGGFTGVSPIGSIAIASEMIAADLGAESPDGFIELSKLGFGITRVQAATDHANKLLQAARSAGQQAVLGPILSVNTATGTAETTTDLLRRYPDAAAEAMEGYGVALAAASFGIPSLEVRAISNMVGPRDRAAWRIGDALHSLEAVTSLWKEVWL